MKILMMFAALPLLMGAFPTKVFGQVQKLSPGPYEALPNPVTLGWYVGPLKNAPVRRGIPDAETKAVINNCLGIIRAACLPDGSIRMSAAGDPVWVQRYFELYCCLALLTTGERQDQQRVLACLTNLSKTQSHDGHFNDLEGRVSTGWQSNGKHDSADATCGLFLLVSYRYHLAVGTLPHPVKNACLKALNCIRTLTDPGDNLPIAKKTWAMKYLMDAIECLAGEHAAIDLFKRIGNPVASQTAAKLYNGLNQALPSFFIDQTSWYAYVKEPNGAFTSGQGDLARQGLANLFAVSTLSLKPSVWNQITLGFVPDNGLAPKGGVEFFARAAFRYGDASTVNGWRKSLLKQGGSYTIQNCYSYRPALTVLTLTQGSYLLRP